MNLITQVFLLAVIQSLYDFIGWFGIIKENDTHKFKLVFRVIKELLDFVVVPAISYFYFDVSLVVLAAFFIAKWCHLCDSFYNIYRYILTKEPTSVWGYWRWWTPLGLLRTNWWGVCIVKGYTELDYNNKTGNWKVKKGLLDNFFKKSGSKPESPNFARGMVSIQEAWIQTGIGLVVTCIILYIGL